MRHFDFLETTARAAGQQVRRLRRDLPLGRQDELLGTIEDLISATATTARACQAELKRLRGELAAMQARLEGLEKAARREPSPPQVPFG